MNKRIKFKLNRFFDKNFFDNAYESAYTITDENTENDNTENTEETPSDNSSNEEEVETPQEQPQEEEKPTTIHIEGIGELTPEQIKDLYSKANTVEEPQKIEKPQEEPQYSQDVQDALELYKYLESNPQLIAQLQQTNPQAYQDLTQRVPDETTKRLRELEEYVEEQRYNNYISELKGKFSDFDEDKVLEYAEKHDVTDLEVAYKAMKAETVKPTDMEALTKQIREQVKQELMEELKNNSLNTQSIISSSDEPNMGNEKEVTLSPQERRVARGLGMSDEEYAKWAN